MCIQAYVLPKISSYAPSASHETEYLNHIMGLTLADPGFCRWSQIEILLSTSVHASIVEGEVRRGAETDSVATKSKLGYFISGNAGIG